MNRPGDLKRLGWFAFLEAGERLDAHVSSQVEKTDKMAMNASRNRPPDMNVEVIHTLDIGCFQWPQVDQNGNIL